MRIAPSKSTVRWMIFLEITLKIISAAVEKLAEFDGSFWEKNLNAPANSAFGGLMTWPQLIAGVVLVFLGLIAYIGIFRFWRPARGIYLLFHFLALTSQPVFGPCFETAWGEIFATASAMVTGAVLALLFFTPLKEHFRKKAKGDAPTPLTP